MKNRHPKKTRQQTKRTPESEAAACKYPFQQHLHELRRRLLYTGASIILWSLAAYAVQQKIVALLLKPSHGQKFIYTSPIGGIDFLFRVSLYTGIIISVPVIAYHLLKFVAPLMRNESSHFVAWCTTASGALAIIGIVFGYLVGLPAALHFLLHQFMTGQITPLITIQSYMSFVMVYMVGAALMFQVPLIIIIINRIKPLKPSQLLRKERWVVLFAFIISGLMNPTPNLLDQLIVVGPIIIMYQLSIGLIAYARWRDRRTGQVESLLQQDVAAQARRLATAQTAQRLYPRRPLTGSITGNSAAFR